MSIEQPQIGESHSERDDEPCRSIGRRLFDMTLVVGAVVLATLSFAWWMGGETELPPVGGLEPGQIAPPIEAEGWVNGPAPTAEDLAGKVVVVHAWFLNCPFCKLRAPEFAEAHAAFKDRGVVFIGLTYERDDLLPEIRQFCVDTDSTWPNGYGALPTLVDFDTQAFPSIWVIGRDGRIVWNHDSEGELADGIELALSRR